MSGWPSVPARRVLAGLERIGWTIKRQNGSHLVLAREGWPNFVFAFHDREEIGPEDAGGDRPEHGSEGGRYLNEFT